jgi:hypothetical protein
MGGDRGNWDGWSDPMDDDRLPEVFDGRLPEFFPATFPAIFFVVFLIPPRLDGRALMGSVDPSRVCPGDLMDLCTSHHCTVPSSLGWMVAL